MKADVTPLERELFREAVDTVITEERNRQGIGRLGEKVVHASLKLFLEPDRSLHEVKVGSFVADIRNERGITEIQTGSFTPLRRKLEAFLPEVPVTVVYPVADVRRLIWIDADGSFSAPRKCPRRPMRGRGAALGELVKILDVLDHPSFTFLLVSLDLDEYRLKNGWGNGGKRGSTRFERIPTGLKEIRFFRSPADYAAFLPAGLPERFDSALFSRLSRLKGRGLWAALKVLCHVGVLEREKEGRRFYYRTLFSVPEEG